MTGALCGSTRVTPSHQGSLPRESHLTNTLGSRTPALGMGVINFAFRGPV